MEPSTLGGGLDLNFLGWTWYQYAGLCCGFFPIGLGGFIIWTVFFALPHGTFYVPKGEDFKLFWREVMDERETRRGRITRRMVFSIGVGIGLILLTGALWLVIF